MRRSGICLLLLLALGGCTLADVTTRSAGQPTEVIVVEPTADEVRAAQMREQREDIDALRDALAENRARAESEAARSKSETRQAQSEIRALQAKLAEIAQHADAVDTRSDAEKLQARSEISKLQAQLVEVRVRADAVDKRSEAEKLQAQSEIRTLQAQLGEVRVRADSAAAQSDKAFAIATEFLSNLVAAREEQRSIVERNISSFGGMEQRLAEIEKRISETRQLSQAEIAATRTRSSVLEQRLGESDTELTALREQLLQVHKQNEETRASLDSGPMLQMLRQLEGTQRDTSGLRGAFEEMQLEQEAARKRMQNYYLDLDARIQALQAKERAAREAELANPESVEDDSIMLDPVETGAADSTPSAADADPSVESGESEHASDVVPTPDAASVDDIDADGAATRDPELQAGQNELDNTLPANPVEVPVEISVDALPDIVDTVDIMPGEPVSAGEDAPERRSGDALAPAEDLRDEFNSGEPEASLPESEQGEAQPLARVSATDEILDVHDQQQSAVHAIIITDWSADY